MTLMILPMVTVLGGVLVLAGDASSQLILVTLGMAIWLAQRWSIDRVARRAALALIPDERRARLCFLVELAPIGIGLIVGAAAAATGVWIGPAWPIYVFIIVVALAAVHQGLLVRRGWERSLRNWRLRRRRTDRSLAHDLE